MHVDFEPLRIVLNSTVPRRSHMGSPNELTNFDYNIFQNLKCIGSNKVCISEIVEVFRCPKYNLIRVQFKIAVNYDVVMVCFCYFASVAVGQQMQLGSAQCCSHQPTSALRRDGDIRYNLQILYANCCSYYYLLYLCK